MRRILLATLMLAGLFCASSQASPILTGQFDIAGFITVMNPGTTTPAISGPVLGGLVCPAGTQCIYWADPAATFKDKADIAGGMTVANNGPVFTGLDTPPGTFSGNDKANIFDLFNPPAVVGGGGFPNQLFMSFVDPVVTTTLLVNFIPNGVFLPTACSANPAAYAAGQICTTPGSLFSFINGAGHTSSATWTLQGVTNDGQSNWTGVFSAQFATSYQQVLLDLQNNGFVGHTYSATIALTSAGVPEAGTMSLLGLGLVLFGTLARRKTRKS